MDWMTTLPGLVVAALGSLLSYWWFGVHKRKQLEVAAGVQALSGMKWRECAGLVMEALVRHGYAEEMSSRQPGDGGTEFLLRRSNESVLMSYKHGTAYKLGDSNIREFANAIQLCGASSGILITLGSVEGVARELARRYEIKLLDGNNVWPLVENLVTAGLRDNIRAQAAAQNRMPMFAGGIGSIVLGALILFIMAGNLPTMTANDSAPTDATQAAASARAPMPAITTTVPYAQPASTAPATAMPSAPLPAPPPQSINSAAGIEAANRAMAEIAKLSDGQLAKRRADAVAKIAGINQVSTANWLTQSTLVLSLAYSDGKDVALVTEACDRLSRYEELRYMRLQLEPPAGSDYQVRWRMCQ